MNNRKNVDKVNNEIFIEEVRTEKSFQEALNLHDVLYENFNKQSTISRSYNNYLATIDSSVIYLIKVEDLPVGVFEIAFGDDHVDQTKEIKSLKEKNFRIHSKLKKSIVVKSLAIRPRYRKPIVFKKLCNTVHERLVRVRKEYIYISTEESLLSKYKLIGFISTGIKYYKTKKNGEKSSLFILETRQKRFGTYGLHADPLRWNLFLEEATTNLIKTGVLKHNFFQKVIFSFYSLFKRPALYLEKKSRERYRKKKYASGIIIRKIS